MRQFNSYEIYKNMPFGKFVHISLICLLVLLVNKIKQAHITNI